MPDRPPPCERSPALPVGTPNIYIPSVSLVPVGCICPPGSNAACERPDCPRKPARWKDGLGSGSVARVVRSSSLSPKPIMGVAAGSGGVASSSLSSKSRATLHPSSFSGANGMKAGDRVRYTPTGQTGIALEFLQDGEATVQFDDGASGLVKWRLLEPAQGGER